MKYIYHILSTACNDHWNNSVVSIMHIYIYEKKVGGVSDMMHWL